MKKSQHSLCLFYWFYKSLEHIRVITSVLALLLLRLRTNISIGVSVDPPCYFLIESVDKSNLGCFLFDPGVYKSAAVPHFLIDLVLDHDILPHHEALDSPAQKIKRQAEKQVKEEKYLQSTFSLIDPPFVESDQISVLVD